MAQYLRLPGKDQEGSGAACNVLCVQVSCCVPVQRETAAEEETHGQFQYFVHNTQNERKVKKNCRRAYYSPGWHTPLFGRFLVQNLSQDTNCPD